MDIQHKIDGVGVMRLNKLLRILDSCLAREVMAVCVKRCFYLTIWRGLIKVEELIGVESIGYRSVTTGMVAM